MNETIFSLVSKKCRELGFLIPKKTPDDNKKKKGKDPEPFDPAHPHKNYKKTSDDVLKWHEQQLMYAKAIAYLPSDGGGH